MQQHNGTSMSLTGIMGNAELGLRSTWGKIDDALEQPHGLPGLFQLI